MTTGPSYLIRYFGGTVFSREPKEPLGGWSCTALPPRRTRSVEQQSIAKRAWADSASTNASVVFFFHIGIAKRQTADDKLYLFVAIDRASLITSVLNSRLKVRRCMGTTDQGKPSPFSVFTKPAAGHRAKSPDKAASRDLLLEIVHDTDANVASRPCLGVGTWTRLRVDDAPKPTRTTTPGPAPPTPESTSPWPPPAKTCLSVARSQTDGNVDGQRLL